MYRYLLVYGLYLELIIIVASNLFINWENVKSSLACVICAKIHFKFHESLKNRR